ncbi:hypothetical protein ASF72_10700 [Arthrobacter sp. Leaf141]|uniref:hypothetical protein n=1 Tax=Arthrobacter sp. Leaf141 TaxID=1736273 RepID=UPI0006F40583|nr:hypothetical protein [Arthrobacter sp. Leaf141]KQR02495.1 hypothetical protein ASF72_10700 [Arthrobacter sp. Leaf141]
MKEEVRFCTAEECKRLTTLYLCTVCIVELADLLQDVTPILERIDAVIYRQTVTSAPGAGGGGGVASSKPAMNVDAYMLKAHLHSLPTSAHAEAMENTVAGQTLYMAREWVTSGRDLVWGPEEKRVYGKCGVLQDAELETEDEESFHCDGPLVAHPDDATVRCPDCNTVHQVNELLDRLRQRARGNPLPPRGVREHLQRSARVQILTKDFENWVQLGKLAYVLDRVTTNIRAQRLYYPGDVLTVRQEMRARRRM